MICGELREFYELYVMDALEVENQVALREHLSRNCPVCTDGVKRAAAFTSLLAVLPPPIAPPVRLRRRILLGAGGSAAGRSWLALAAALAICAILAAGLAWVQARRSAAERAGLQQEVAMLVLPGTRQIEAGSYGRVLVNPARGVLLVLPHLASAGPGRCYEMWTIPKGKPPVPSGLFQPSRSGSTLYWRAGGVDETTGAIAVSIEPASGSAAPTTTPVFVAPL